jgi:hypothetical protein
VSIEQPPAEGPRQAISGLRPGQWLADIRVALPLAFRQWGATTLWTVIVLPILIDQLAAAFHPGATPEERVYAGWLVFVAVAVALLTLGPAARSQVRQLRATRRVTQIDATNDEQLQDVRCLVSLRGTPRKRSNDPSKAGTPRQGEQQEAGTVKTLLPLMKGVEQLVLIGSSESSSDIWKGDWADPDLRRRVHTKHHLIEIQAFKEPAHNLETLVESLRKLVRKYGTSGVAVDLTQGTAMMTLAAYEAAAQLGVRTIYVGDKRKDPDAPLVMWSPASPSNGQRRAP